ncbi:MAG: rhomboid family intramembrane serine protease [Planctomycetota bacterium]
MRRIGTLPEAAQAERFGDYLQTESIDYRMDDEDPPISVWIREERDVPRAKALFDAFAADPSNERYNVSESAKALRKQEEKDQRRKAEMLRRNQQKLARRTSMTGRPGAGGRAGYAAGVGSDTPVTLAVMVIAVLVALITAFGNTAVLSRPTAAGGESLGLKVFKTLYVVDYGSFLETEDPLYSVKRGQVWRVVTPMFLHSGPMHLVFNMLALFSLGGVVERLHGHLFMLGLLLITQVAATMTQILLPDWLENPLAVGASGAVLGVFGFLWVRPKVQANYPVEIPQANVAFILGFVFLCLTPLLPNIANGAHFGGLGAGILIAFVWPRWKD